MGNSKEGSSVRVSLRLATSLLSLIDRAASLQGKSRTAFILESARMRASGLLIDPQVYELDPRASEVFGETLANPPEPKQSLRQLMRSKAPWE